MPDFESHTCLYPIRPLSRAALKPRPHSKRSISLNRRSHQIKQTFISLEIQYETLDIGLLLLVGTWFQVLFIPLEGVLFIFQSPYCPLLVVKEYLALEGGPPSFTRSFTSSVLLW